MKKSTVAAAANNNDLSPFAIVCIAAALMFFYNCNCSAAEIAKDKQQHIAVSALIAAPAAVYLEDTGHPILYGIAVAMVPGILKEVYDSRHPKSHTASGADLVADLVGATSGALIGHGISLRMNGKSASINYSVQF